MAQNVVTSTVIDDTQPNVTYAGSGWTFHTNVQSIYHLYNSSDSFSSTQGDTATFKFYGSAIEYWGNQGPYHGPCTLTLDGNYVGTVNSNAALDGYSILLYSNNNLQLGDHTLVITVKNESFPNTCEVDSFVVNVTTAVTYTSSYVYTGPGSTATGAAVPSGSVANNGYNNGTTNATAKSSPPIAAIAGAVGGVAVIALLFIAWWCLRRSKRNKSPGNSVHTKVTEYGKPTSRNGGIFAPAADAEKVPFRPNAVVASSYVSSSPPPSTYGPSSPPASTVGYNSYPFGATALTATPTVVSHTASPPGSPQPTTRPMSAASSAYTTSYYTGGAPTTESGGFNAFSPQQPGPTITPAWVAPTSVQPITHTPVPTQPSPTPSPVPTPALVPVAAAVEARPEKARYAGFAVPPEKARFMGSSTNPSDAGASSSAAPTVNTAAAATSGSGQAGQNDVILSPTVPDAPPPAYQL